MAAQVTNYQCPACTGPLHFVGESGKLECEYCGSSYTVEQIEALFAQKDEAASQAKAEADEKRELQKKENEESGWDTSGMSDNWGADAEGMRAYSCPACGAEIICDETTAATSCPYCDNPTIIPGQFGGVLKPDYVIPFKLDKAAAIKALKEHYKGRPFLPKVFKDANKLEEIKGIYVPFWLFNGEAEGSMSFEGEKVDSYTSGGYKVTNTHHYDIYRAGKASFERIPVDASKKMPDDYMDSLEPFDYSEIKDFSTAYLPGYFADKYDVSVDESSERADARARSTIESGLKNSVRGYAATFERGSNIWVNRGEVKYALLPVWILNTKWNGTKYMFAMNGQTGKFVGHLPVDKKKRMLTFAGVFVPLFIIMLLIMLFSGGLLSLLAM